jgi:hypothetical protein
MCLSFTLAIILDRQRLSNREVHVLTLGLQKKKGLVGCAFFEVRSFVDVQIFEKPHPAWLRFVFRIDRFESIAEAIQWPCGERPCLRIVFEAIAAALYLQIFQ